MMNQQLIDVHKDKLDREIKIRHHLALKKGFYLTLLLILFRLIYFVTSESGHISSRVVSAIFIGLLIVSIACILFCALFFVRSFWSYGYKEIPSLIEYYKSLEIYKKKHKLKDNFVFEEISKETCKYYSDVASDYGKTNKKIGEINDKLNKSLVVSFILVFFCVVTVSFPRLKSLYWVKIWSMENKDPKEKIKANPLEIPPPPSPPPIEFRLDEGSGSTSPKIKE